MAAKAIMIQGTTSNAGKSALAAALCRIFAESGLRVAPFKAWNMSANSYTTKTGLQIGVAQGIQADILGLEPTGMMNPIFLKPCVNGKTEVYIRGELRKEAIQDSFKDYAWPIIQESLQELQETFDVLVLEGAGSPVELNIKSKEVANMRVARYANAPVLLVADVHRGGALAGVIGTFDLLEPEEKGPVIGSVLNKFRGDLEILKPGCAIIKEYTGLPVVGVIPHCQSHGLAEEDGAEGRLGDERFSEQDFSGFVATVRENLDLEYIYTKMGLVE